MGADIHTFVEVKKDGHWDLNKKKVFKNSFIAIEPNIKYIAYPFDYRHYGMFGFLADVRNYSSTPVIAEPRGVPDDISSEVSAEYDDWWGDAHSASWFTAKELLDYNYNVDFIDTRDGNTKENLKEFLGTEYFEDLEALKKLGDPENVRVVFWFDN